MWIAVDGNTFVANMPTGVVVRYTTTQIMSKEPPSSAMCFVHGVAYDVDNGEFRTLTMEELVGDQMKSLSGMSSLVGSLLKR